MNPRNILTIIKKELTAYLDSPTAYIVLVVFLFLWEYLFFRSVFLVGEASLRILLTYTPWLFVILIPALTMGSISAEKADGTLELILTHPVKSIELIIGKFLSTLIFVTIAILFMAPLAASLNQFGNIDWGVVVGQMVGSILLAAVFVSIGIFVSSLFNSQISSLLVAAAASFFFVIAGFELITLSLPGPVAKVFERLSVLSHFESIARGVIDLRDVWYFASAIIIFLSLAYAQLLKLRLGNRKKIYQRYLLGIGLFIGIAVLVNIIGERIPGRIDLTEGKLYQLTTPTKQTLDNLDDVVTIKLFATEELPAQLRPILRDTKDILKDYQTYGNGKIQVISKDPSRDNVVAAEANSLGVREVQFNVIGQEEFQLKKGYLGLAVLYGGNTEIVPLISQTSDLEYQLTSFIKKLTTTDKKTIAFVTGHGEKLPSLQYQTWKTELDKFYQVEEIDLDEEDQTIKDTITTVIVAGPQEEIPDATREKLKSFIDQGGSVLFLLDGTIVNEAALTASVNDYSLTDFLSSYGLAINPDITYDLRSSETVNFGGQGINFLLQYPFWPRAVAADRTSPIVTKINSIVLTWPSSLTINEQTLTDRNLEAKKLLATTQFGGKQVGNFNIQPNQQIAPSNLGEQVLAVSLIGKGDQANAPRLVVVGDSDFLTDQIAQNTPENIAFATEAVSWLSQEQSLAEIQLKQRDISKLLFQVESQQTLIKYGNLLLAVALPVIIGTTRIINKRNLKYQKYPKTHE